jgi:hypothetical protein
MNRFTICLIYLNVTKLRNMQGCLKTNVFYNMQPMLFLLKLL